MNGRKIECGHRKSPPKHVIHIDHREQLSFQGFYQYHIEHSSRTNKPTTYIQTHAHAPVIVKCTYIYLTVRTGGLDPASACCGMTTLTFSLFWMSFTVSPPLPIIKPTLSSGTTTCSEVDDALYSCCTCCCWLLRVMKISTCAASTASLLSAPIVKVRT